VQGWNICMTTAGLSHSTDFPSPRVFASNRAMRMVAMNAIGIEILLSQGSLPPLNTYHSSLANSSAYNDGISPSSDAPNLRISPAEQSTYPPNLELTCLWIMLKREFRSHSHRCMTLVIKGCVQTCFVVWLGFCWL
jgi:hypothetical protein